MARKYKYAPIHPGKILQKEFIDFLGLNQACLANALQITPARINEIVKGKRGITAETSLRLSRYFGNSAEFWMELQSRYELWEAKKKLKGQLDEIWPFMPYV